VWYCNVETPDMFFCSHFVRSVSNPPTSLFGMSLWLFVLYCIVIYALQFVDLGFKHVYELAFFFRFFSR
jgi:hypothetical protein